MTNQSKTIVNQSQEELARFCAAIGNHTRIAILETLACHESCESDIREVAGLSRFTVGVNLKYLKKYGLIKGSFTSKNISYCIDHEQLDHFKNLFDTFYNKVTENKQKINSVAVCCG